MVSVLINFLFNWMIALGMFISGIYAYKNNTSKFEIIWSIIVVPISLVIIFLLSFYSYGINTSIKKYKEVINLKSTEVDSIVYESKVDRILVVNREVIETLIHHYNEMESTMNYGHGNSELSFDLYIYAKNKIKLEHNYSGLGNLIISIPGVGDYYSEGLGYYMNKEYLQQPIDTTILRSSVYPSSNSE